jgi:hypothetical protein
LSEAIAVKLDGRVRRLALSRWGLLLVLVGGAGIALRVAIYRSVLGTTNSDEAVVGLMVRHALHGQFTTFLWGTAYGGTQEVLLTVPVFWIAGSSLLALRVVPMALDVVATLLIWRVGRRTIGEPAARVAAALYWIWPPYVVATHGHQVGFYASDAMYCGLIVLLALRVRERPDAVRVGLLGLVLGLAFWQTSQIVPIAIPVLGWLIWRQPRAIRHAPLAACLAAVGALPWLIWNAGHGWASLHLGAGADTSYVQRLRILASPVLPMTVGLRVPYSLAWLVPVALAAVVYAGLLVLFAYSAYATRHRNASLLYVVAASFPFLCALAPQAWISTEPRYTVVLVPVLALLFAQLATNYVRAVSLLALACIVSAVTLQKMDAHVRNVPGPLPSTPRSLHPLIATLDRLHLDRVYANFWIAYRLSFESNERIIAVENKFDDLTLQHGRLVPLHDRYVRYRPYDTQVENAPHGFVFFKETQPRPHFLNELVRNGYTRHVVGSFVVYAPG